MIEGGHAQLAVLFPAWIFFFFFLVFWFMFTNIHGRKTVVTKEEGLGVFICE